MRALPLGVVVAAVNQLTLDADRFVVGATLVAAARSSRRRSRTRAPWRANAARRHVSGRWHCGGVPRLRAGGTPLPLVRARRRSLACARRAGSSCRDRRRRSFSGSLKRGLALGRVDYVHAAGSLATLVILFFIMRFGLALLLESQADNTVRTAIFLADTVLAPLLFLGGAILYVDQEARIVSRGDDRKE